MTITATSAGTARLTRPTLLPGLRRLWRGRRLLQLGTDPTRAVILELPHQGAAHLLDLLDGTRSERAVLAEARRFAITQADALGLLDSLRAAGLVVAARSLLPPDLPGATRHRLVGEATALALRGTGTPATPAQTLRRRAAAKVVINGRGRLVAPIALALAEAGVGHVWPSGLDRARGRGPDPGPARSPGRTRPPGQATAPEDLAAMIARAAPGTRTTRLRRGEATFAVQVGMDRPAALVSAGYLRLAHLAVSVRDGTAVIGPLVPPSGSPCLHCLDLHRADRDPAWPALAAQLAAPAPDDEPCAVATLLSAAGLAAAEVLSWLDGHTPTTLAASVEITSPGQPRRRSWAPHPECGCVHRNIRAREAPGAPDRRPGRRPPGTPPDRRARPAAGTAYTGPV